ncbi:MAG: mechanosensitive ion channel family protein [Rhodospirillales bacterium]
MEGLDKLPDVEQLQSWLLVLTTWTTENLLIVSSAIQALVILICLVVAKMAAPALRKLIRRLPDMPRIGPHLHRLSEVLSGLAFTVIWLVLQALSVGVAANLGWANGGIEAVVSLLTAWVVIRLATAFVGSPTRARMIATLAWAVAALNILGLLGPLAGALDGFALSLGDFRLSLWGLLKGVAALALLLWIAGAAAALLERRLNASRALTPSLKVLLGKVGRILLYSLAVLLGLDAVGIDLTALAVFSGAVGLGIGFGLQKVVSNLISGVILLLDRSVKPGDVIVIGETYGWINKLGGRYVSVITRDGTEHLIPNEELISTRVENWSHSDNLVRLKLPFGVDYATDLKKAIELAKQAACEVDRVLEKPAPVCNVLGFGDSDVSLELRIWIQDPANGVGNVKSQVYLKVWDLFHENDITFPYPQRDVNFTGPIRVQLERSNKSES